MRDVLASRESWGPGMAGSCSGLIPGVILGVEVRLCRGGCVSSRQKCESAQSVQRLATGGLGGTVAESVGQGRGWPPRTFPT
jgi:hypothetical protein